MTNRKRTIFGTLAASLLSVCGCGQSAPPDNGNVAESTVVEEIAVHGFDPDGEPIIKKLSNGSLWIHFEAMPPFFAEDQGIEAEFENFEIKLQDALGVDVRRDDREIFIIEKPNVDTAENAKAWLQTYRKNGA